MSPCCHPDVHVWVLVPEGLCFSGAGPSGWLERVCLEGTQPAGNQGEDPGDGLAGPTTPMSKEASAVEWGPALWLPTEDGIALALSVMLTCPCGGWAQEGGLTWGWYGLGVRGTCPLWEVGGPEEEQALQDNAEDTLGSLRA